jgi:hypothetical protein
MNKTVKRWAADLFSIMIQESGGGAFKLWGRNRKANGDPSEKMEPCAEKIKETYIPAVKMKRKRSFLNRAQEIASFLPINLCSPQRKQLKQAGQKNSM